MSDNIYAAPRANLDELPSAAAGERFYVVAPRKMLVLWLLTMGLYQLYWYYKNWALYDRATGAGLWPAPRALFAVFSTHSLFRRIGEYDASGTRRPWDNGSYAAAVVFLLVVGYVLTWAGQDSLFFDAINVFLLLPLGLLMQQVQAEVNVRCGDPDGDGNSAFTGANYAWCVFGGMLWLMVLTGWLLPLPAEGT